jgi:hypothetical protein
MSRARDSESLFFVFFLFEIQIEELVKDRSVLVLRLNWVPSFETTRTRTCIRKGALIIGSAEEKDRNVLDYY